MVYQQIKIGLDFKAQLQNEMRIVGVNRGGKMQVEQWILCPVCGNKTRLKIREETELKNFPLFCPKCKQETIINIRQFNMSVINEPDAQTQSR